MESGSIFSISWFHDGTQFACGGGNGSVSFASIVDRSISNHNLEASIDENNTITVRNVADDTVEELDHRDRVVDMALGPSGHLVVTTSSQCFVYTANSWSNPHVEDLKEPAHLIIMCPYHFCLVDTLGINLYSYEGRQVSTVKYPGLRVELLNHLTLSICRDTLALVDPSTPKIVRLLTPCRAARWELHLSTASRSSALRSTSMAPAQIASLRSWTEIVTSTSRPSINLTFRSSVRWLIRSFGMTRLTCWWACQT